MKQTFIALMLLLGTTGLAQAVAVGEPLEFETTEQRELYQGMLQELRCTVCQNQSLADSNAGLAEDLRSHLYEMVSSGADRDAIKTFMVERYGEFVLYRPTLRPATYLLWFGPLLLLLIGVVVLRMNIRARVVASEQQTLSDEEQQRLRRFLDNRQEK